MKRSFALALLLAVHGPFALAEDVPRAVPLRPASPGAISRQAIARFCGSLPSPCDPARVQAFAPARPMPAPLYLIEESGPALLGVSQQADGALHLLFRHDFADHRQAEQPVGWADEGPRRLHPALYPVAPGRWAVALVSRRSEMYSGGGASFERADFIPLNGGAVLHAGIPFSCDKMIRACFSEADYRSGRACHDTYTGVLSIRYQAAKPDYRWQFFWHADGARRGELFMHPGEAGFCGGDQG